MHRCLAVAWLVGLGTAVLPAAEWPSSFADGKKQSAVSAVRIVPFVRFHDSSARRTSVFVMRTAIPSNGDVVEIVDLEGQTEPADDESTGQQDPGLVRILPEAPSDEVRTDSSFPPSVGNSKKPKSLEAVPLDGATYEDSLAQSAAEKKHPASSRSAFAWIAGENNRLGMLELDLETLSRIQYDPTRADQTVIDLTFGARWLNGPSITDLPPYLFNVLINIGQSIPINDRLRIDGMISPGWYTDFSNKGVESFRLPWHIVSYYGIESDWYWVMGVTDLGRRDIRYLPVLGTVYAPEGGDIRLDLVFPKPQVAYKIRENSLRDGVWMSFGGELGGGSWAISRENRAYDVVTLRDYRLIAGLESRAVKRHSTRLEVGWIFGRAVEYQSGTGDYNPPDSIMIRVSTDY